MNTTALKSNLLQFTGTENYHRFSALFRNTLLTDGAKYLADKAECYWLFDIIGSVESKFKKEYFWNVKIKVKNNKGVVTIDDGNKKVFYTQNIDHTDFPLEEYSFYAIHDGTRRICMLKSEY